MAKNLREKIFLVKIGPRKKGFLKPKSGQKRQKIEEEKNSQHWGKFKKKLKRFYFLSQNWGEYGKNLKNQDINGFLETEKVLFQRKSVECLSLKPKLAQK